MPMPNGAMMPPHSPANRPEPVPAGAPQPPAVPLPQQQPPQYVGIM